MNKIRITDNINRIKENIAQAAEKSGRELSDIHLMAVTKTFSYEAVECALDAGLTLFGESKIQEAESKYPAERESYNLHMIGHLQTNKAKKAVGFFDMIQSVDSFHLAQELNKHAKNSGVVYPVLLEINIGAEESKYGFHLDDSYKVADKFYEFENLNVQGLMAVPPLLNNVEETRPYFVKMRELFDYLSDKFSFSNKFRYLSMGMSYDYVVAVEEGSNMVRLGTAIFGEREYGL